MRQMRRIDRKVTDFDEILGILAAEKVCRLAMVDADGPYIVPLNFGYALTPQGGQGQPDAQGNQRAQQGNQNTHTTDGLPQALTLYFHSAASGRKIDALRKNPNVCFALDGAHALVQTEAMTDCTYHYDSIIGDGVVEFITDPVARLDAMVALMRQQTGMTDAAIRAMPRDERWMKNEVMAVFAVKVIRLSAKRHQ